MFRWYPPNDHLLPWITLAPGVESKPLAFFRDERGWVSLLRLVPGTCIPVHRHIGEAHGYLLAGERRIEPNGPLLKAGSYDNEPAGQLDSWRAQQESPLLGLFIVHGGVEYLDAAGRVLRVETTTSKVEAYLRACDEQGVRPLDLYR